ncbi:hypothetical protein D3C77_717020 [compost metagenome]
MGLRILRKTHIVLSQHRQLRNGKLRNPHSAESFLHGVELIGLRVDDHIILFLNDVSNVQVSFQQNLKHFIKRFVCYADDSRGIEHIGH